MNDHIRELLQESMTEDERITTLGELSISEDGVTIRLIAIGHDDQPCVMFATALCLSMTGDGMVLAECGGGYTEFPGDYPCLVKKESDS